MTYYLNNIISCAELKMESTVYLGPMIGGQPIPVRDAPVDQCENINGFYRKKRVQGEVATGMFGIKKHSWTMHDGEQAYQVTCSTEPIFGLNLLTKQWRNEDFKKRPTGNERHCFSKISDISADGVMEYQIPFGGSTHTVKLPKPYTRRDSDR